MTLGLRPFAASFAVASLAVSLAACEVNADAAEAAPRTPMPAGTAADPGIFGPTASAPRPTVRPSAGWDTLWAALRETPLGPDGMTRVGPFPEAVAAWDGTDATVTGYMIPLDASMAPTRFLLVGVPLADCAFCIPNGPAGAIEVLAREGVPGTYDPISLRGRFQTLDADPNGVLFRLTDAVLP
ncbi:MAG: hypothetical protein AAF845_02630 [Bacteroidota bacterium]